MKYHQQFILQDHGDHGGGGGGGGGGDGGDGGHGGHGGQMCSMNMLFNWDTKNLCIVFSWWRVDNIGFLILSCLIVISLGILYELIGFLSRKYDASIYNSSAAELQDDGFEENATVTSEIQTEVQKRNRVFRITFKQQMIRSLIYTVQVFISFFTMLIFMTYNGFLMFSVAIGAGIGYLFFWETHIITKL